MEVRIEFDDEEQYERLKELKKHRGLTWKGLLLEGQGGYPGVSVERGL